MSQRRLFCNVAEELYKAGELEKAEEILDRCQECVPEANYPFDLSYLRTGNELAVVQMVDLYYRLGADEKATEMAWKFGNELLSSIRFYLEFYDFARSNYEEGCQYLYYLTDIMRTSGRTEDADAMEKKLEDVVNEVIAAES